jgi:uncharacterized OsmC-like protein
MLSQVSRYGTMLKTNLDAVRMTVTARFHVEGSVLKGTILGSPLEFDLQIDVDSDEPPEKVARVLRTAERTCYVMQSLLATVHVNSAWTLNGDEVAS